MGSLNTGNEDGSSTSGEDSSSTISVDSSIHHAIGWSADETRHHRGSMSASSNQMPSTYREVILEIVDKPPSPEGDSSTSGGNAVHGAFTADTSDTDSGSSDDSSKI